MSPWLIVSTGWPGVALEAGRVIAHAGILPIVAVAATAAVPVAFHRVAARRRRGRPDPEGRSVS